MKSLMKSFTTSMKRMWIDFLEKNPGSRSNFVIFLNLSHSPHHFKRIKISSVALIKMVMHAKKGGDIEVMGLMQGKVKGGKQDN